MNIEQQFLLTGEITLGILMVQRDIMIVSFYTINMFMISVFYNMLLHSPSVKWTTSIGRKGSLANKETQL